MSVRSRRVSGTAKLKSTCGIFAYGRSEAAAKDSGRAVVWFLTDPSGIPAQ